ncbi:hypothetical protein D1007_07548 [Hordeum vulgare]|nr:hypothetical protein D1007_07548 [Hordeum vulgare]
MARATHQAMLEALDQVTAYHRGAAWELRLEENLDRQKTGVWQLHKMKIPRLRQNRRQGNVRRHQAVRANDQKVRQEEEDSNWEALRYGGGLPETDETQLGGEVDMDDVAFVDVDLEEEEEGVEETESWKLLGLYHVQKCPSAKTLSNHFEKI